MNAALIEPEPLLGDYVRLRSVEPPTHPLVVRYTDVVQGRIANCPIAAVMAATAHARPDRIRQLLGAPQVGDVWSIRRRPNAIFHWSTVTYHVRFTSGAAKTVTPVLYHREDQVAYARTPNGPGWPSMVEKAYAIWKGNNSYQNLEEDSGLRPGPDAQTVLADLVGPSDMAYIANDKLFHARGGQTTLRDEHLIAIAQRALHRPTIAGSVEHGAADGIISNHAYAVLRWDRTAKRVVMRNSAEYGAADPRLTIAQLRANFQAVWQAR
ncbi:C2 family cysteine protease [Nocardia xishanensis]